MLRKGFWFGQEAVRRQLETVQQVLKECSIQVYPIITASLLQPSIKKNFLQLVDLLVEKGLVSTDDASALRRQGGSTKILFRNTYDRVTSNSFLTREDMLVIVAEHTGIPIKLSLAHCFIELQDATAFQQAETALAAHSITSVQPEPLPLKKRGEMHESVFTRYLCKQDIYHLSEEAKVKGSYLPDTHH